MAEDEPAKVANSGFQIKQEVAKTGNTYSITVTKKPMANNDVGPGTMANEDRQPVTVAIVAPKGP